jgi:hypothetical protein
MTGVRNKTIAAPLVLLLLGAALSCRERDTIQIVDVSLSNTELYQFPTVGGDEEGARISTQAKHHSVSEIRRSATTDFVATYVYQAARGFVGSDDAEIEVLTGSDGASPPRNIKRIAFRFVIHN